MTYAFSVCDLNQRHANNLEIEFQRSPLQILVIELHLDRDWQFIAAVYLGPSGEPRYQQVNPSFGSERYEIILIKQSGAWSNETHVARKNA